MNEPNFKHGFTLIELLVVVAIIGLLSSIVTVNVNSARIKAKETVVQDNSLNIRQLLELEYSETGSYQGLNPNSALPGAATYLQTPEECDGVNFTGNYVNEARGLCRDMVENAYVSWSPYRLWLGARNPNNGQQEDGQVYSVMYGLPDQDAFYCVGSSGRSSVHYTWEEFSPFTGEGCFKNP